MKPTGSGRGASGPSKPRVAFVDVDTQRDFIEPGGKLYAKGAEAIKPNLGRLVKLACAAGIPIVSSVDAHGLNDAEFASYPPHCIKGTPGQQKVEETRTGRELIVANDPRVTLPAAGTAHVVLEKQTFPLFDNMNADWTLQATRAQTFFVFGVVTEVCVRAAALGLRERGHEVELVTDAIWPLSEEGGRAAIAEMEASGVKPTTTGEVLRRLAPAVAAERS